MRRAGSARPEAIRAERTRSRASDTALSASPTTWIADCECQYVRRHHTETAMKLPKKLARATRQCIATVDPLSDAGTQSKARPMHAPVRPETPTRAYSYIRFSTPQQEAGVSFQR